MRHDAMQKQMMATILAALLALAPAMAGAQEKSAPQAPPKKAEAASAKPPAKGDGPAEEEREAVAPAKEEKTSGGPHEGIKVHGHWTIDVLNPDGTRVSHSEFENALVDTTMALSLLLAHQASPGPWNIHFLCQIPSGSTISNFIVEPAWGNLNSNLTVQPDNLNHVVLQGSTTSYDACKISDVSTQLGFCDATVAPQACASKTPLNISIFTDRSLTTPIPVLANQIVQVTVTLSFS